MTESDIAYENAIGYIARVPAGYEVRITRPGSTHSVVAGLHPLSPDSLAKATRTLDRLAMNPRDTGTSAKGRVWVALAPTFHLTRDRYLATLAAVKSVGGWWSVGYPGQPGAFAAWADRRDDLERIVLGAAA